MHNVRSYCIDHMLDNVCPCSDPNIFSLSRKTVYLCTFFYPWTKQRDRSCKVQLYCLWSNSNTEIVVCECVSWLPVHHFVIRVTGTEEFLGVCVMRRTIVNLFPSYFCCVLSNVTCDHDLCLNNNCMINIQSLF